jgi:signal transduction histidine kinase/CHASE1-domain containing sensor protein
MRRTARIPGRSNSLANLSWLAFGASFGCTVFAAWVVNRLAEQRDETKFSDISARIQGEIEDRLDEETKLGESLAAFMGANPKATSADFDDFLTRSGWPAEFPGVGVISFIEHVQPGKGKVEANQVKRFGLTHVGLGSSLEGTGGDYVLFRCPRIVGKNRRHANIDLDPDRANTLFRARDSGNSEATAVTNLRSDRLNPTPAIVIFTPVYDSPSTPSTTELRKRHIVGYIGLGVRINQLLSPRFTGKNLSREASFTIHAGSFGASRNIVFSDRPQKFASRFVRVETYRTLAGDWTTVFRSLPGSDGSDEEDFSVAILIGGFIFSGFILLMMARQARSHREVSEYALEIERRAACQSLLDQVRTLLSSDEVYETTLMDVGRAAVISFADACVVELISGGKTHRIESFHRDEKVMEAMNSNFGSRPNTLFAEVGMGQALKEGKSELVKAFSPDQAKRQGVDPHAIAFAVANDFRSYMIVPILVLGESIATLTFIVGSEQRIYSQSDLRQADEVARRIGLEIENRRLFQASQQEISKKNSAESALRKLNDDLEEVVNERTRDLRVAVDELEAFCYSVSHDLRAPLRSVDGFSKALLEDYGDEIGEEGLDNLHRIRGAAKKMDELITAMLSLSRLTRAEIAPVAVDLSKIALEIGEELKRESQIDIVVQPSMTTLADPHMVSILLENLISNGAKFSSKSADPRVEIGQTGDTFFVRDNGVGFDPRYSKKLFQPFERLHSASEYPGTGIGLATVSRVVLRHGGKIWAESTPGKGATFFFTFPHPLPREETSVSELGWAPN